MYITKIDPKKPNLREIENAVQALRDGGLVVFPTETAYGLACDASNRSAVKKVFKIKNRPPSKTLPVIAGTAMMAKKYGAMNKMSGRLAKKFWPGPLTLVLPSVPGMPRGVVSEAEEIAVRVSSHPVAALLSKKLGRPIISTSANVSGKKEKYSIAEVIQDLGTTPNLFLDAGKLKKKTPSTIIRCGEEECEVLREGPITLEKLVKVLKYC